MLRLVAVIVALGLGSACWLGHDYERCAGDGDCHASQRCVDNLCELRPGAVRCLEGTGCPPGTRCDTTVLVCVDDPDGGDADRRDAGDTQPSDLPSDDSDDGDERADGPPEDRGVELGDVVDAEAADCGEIDACDGGEPPECRLSDPPETFDDGWACTLDGCGDDGRIFHTPSSALCSSAGVCEVGACNPDFENTADRSGCRVELMAPGTRCGTNRVCRGRECIAAGCGNGVVEVDGGEECEAALAAPGTCVECRWVASRLDLATAPAPLVRVVGEGEGSSWRPVGCSDLDGDERDDLLLFSAPLREVRVLRGPLAAGEVGTGDADAVVRSASPFAPWLGELDGRGRGATRALALMTDEGNLYLYAASRLQDVELTAGVDSADASFGPPRAPTRLAALADLDGDGVQELLLVRHEEPGNAVFALRWGADGALLELPGTLLGERRTGEALGEVDGVTSRAPGGGFWLSDPHARVEALSDEAPGIAYRLPSSWEGGEREVSEGATARVTGAVNGAELRAIATLGPATSSGEVVVLLEPGRRAYVAAESALIAPLRLNDSPAAGLGVWLASTSGVHGAAVADVTGDGSGDLVLYDLGAGLGRGARPGRLRVVPWPVGLGTTVDLDSGAAPFELVGREGDGLAGALRCDVDGDGESELGLVLEDAGGGAGAIEFYEAPPWVPAE